MAHIIDTIRNHTINETFKSLSKAHNDLFMAIKEADIYSKSPNKWGVEMKRLNIDLSMISNPLISKKSEKFVELVNILATVERTLDALSWCSKNYPDLIVEQCHPSTSDDPEGNDIVLVNTNGNVCVRIEVCDVASSRASQNGKEKSDLANLGCNIHIPNDGIFRFIATSSEFAAALSSSKRKWANMHYSYENIYIINTSTVMLKVEPNKT